MGLLSTQGLQRIADTANLTPDEAILVDDLVKVLIANQSRNAERTSYFEGEEGLKNIGIAIPPELTDLRMSCSWPAKAVNALADRSVFDGISFTGQGEMDEIKRIISDNHLGAKYNKAKRCELMHGPAFWTVNKGSGRLPIVIRQHSAEGASGIWDDQNERLKAGLVVSAYDRTPGKSHRPIRVDVYTEEHILIFNLAKNYRWTLTRLPHIMGRPLMEAMVYGATVAKPMGESRISKAVMSITDCAIRESLRSEIHAEMFTAPQKYLLGASKQQAKRLTRYEAFFGSIFALEADPDSNETPQFGQLSQASMEPHIAYMRQLAAQFSGSTDVPISDLGVIHDNPSSAEAIHAAEQSLVIKAETMNEDNAAALESVVQMAVAIMLNKSFDELTSDEAGVVIGFKRPDRPSQASMADAALKIASTPGMEWFGGTDVCQEMLGFTESERVRLKDEKRRAEGRQLVGAFMQNRPLNTNANSSSQINDSSDEEALNEGNETPPEGVPSAA